ncbi:LysR family transcriptional regulator [Gordonia sp. TBRC 11910]|uniref:LysR family transcriptional regulator n=1 Tax=Gordonia asplenii TaxID=2725283 RepID=A0A848KQT4_9ACTN|nr:LysR substrate-binding domain-containing protein [Gordonia asplenii]NMO00287.1 LysR family transcriptional regulator [Gordonia asplenii]
MLNVARLRILWELSRRGTLAEVAAALSYTPSAVSQQLSLLERETGVVLLERVGRGVRLTDHAQALVEHTEVILARLEEAETGLAQLAPTVRGVLRVGSFPTVVLTIAPTALTLLAQRHPELDVEITQREVGEAHSGLLSHQFDVIVGEEYPGMPEAILDGVDRAELLSDPLRLVLPLDMPIPSRLADLAQSPWSLDPADSPTGRWSRGVCRAVGFEPRVQFEAPNPLLHAHLVRTGHAVSMLPALIASGHLDGTTLVGLPGDPQRTLYTAVRSGRADHPAIRAFRRALTDAARMEEAPEPVVRLVQ